MSGRALADAVRQKFKAAVPVFFSLCRRLRLSRLDLILRLSDALVFSLLYGCEFIRRADIISECESAWWKGVRAFYGLPSGVSKATLFLLFPRVALVDRVVRAKFNLLFRGSQPHSTLFPEAVICDRGFLFASHRRGYSQSLKDWCDHLGFPDLFFASDMARVRTDLEARRVARVGEHWGLFSSMSSTSFAASIFSSPASFHSTAFEASKSGRLGVRAFLLCVTGTLSLSYCKSKMCTLCGDRFSFEHLLSCDFLGPPAAVSLRAFVEAKDWKGCAVFILSRFEVFVHAIRGGELSDEESELFGWLVAVGEESSQE
jgi:hypothetical protein